MKRIIRENGDFEFIYQESSKVIRCISDETNNLLHFEFASGEMRSFPYPKWYEAGYTFQYGISVTSNGERFFIPGWERGLFCYSLENGELLWHFKRKHATKLIFNEKQLVCFFSGWGAASISISDGTLIGRYSLTTDLGWSEIVDESHLMLSPKRNCYVIIDMEPKEAYRIPIPVLNPGNYYSFFIEKIELNNDILTISGVEQSEEVSRRWWDDEALIRFERSIHLDEFKV